MTRAELPERIKTDRLVLRVRKVADAKDIHAYATQHISIYFFNYFFNFAIFPDKITI